MLSNKPVESLGYEEALRELDQLTRLVEQGQLSLRDALIVRQRKVGGVLTNPIAG